MNATHILDENEKGPMTVKSRRQLIRHLNEFQNSRFGSAPNQEQRMAVAKAAETVFNTMSAVCLIFFSDF